jgi:hypothetical protein
MAASSGQFDDFSSTRGRGHNYEGRFAPVERQCDELEARMRKA